MDNDGGYALTLFVAFLGIVLYLVLLALGAV